MHRIGPFALLLLLAWPQRARAEDWWLAEKQRVGTEASITVIDKQSITGSAQARRFRMRAIYSEPDHMQIVSFTIDLEFDCPNKGMRILSVVGKDVLGQIVPTPPPWDKPQPAMEVIAGTSDLRLLAFACEGLPPGFQRIGNDKQLAAETARLFRAMAATRSPPPSSVAPMDRRTAEAYLEMRKRDDDESMKSAIRLALRAKQCEFSAGCEAFADSLNIEGVECREIKEEKPLRRTCGFNVLTAGAAPIPCTIQLTQRPGNHMAYWDYRADWQPDLNRSLNSPTEKLLADGTTVPIIEVPMSTLSCSGDLPRP